MEAYKLNGRSLCWDWFMADKQESVTLFMHKPEKKDLALICDQEWEGNCNGNETLVKLPDGSLRIYYRGLEGRCCADGTLKTTKTVFCMAESRDGIRFTKPDLGLYEFNGTKHNNIVFMQEQKLDNFSVFYDENPNCPPEERFKALSGYLDWETDTHTLSLFTSPDGLRFTFARFVELYGHFDSTNLAFWDHETQQYYLYARCFLSIDTPELEQSLDPKDAERQGLRHIKVITSPDFVHWSGEKFLTFGEDKRNLQLYTNQVMKYYRAKDMFLGMPTRYINRAGDTEQNRAHLPLPDRREFVTKFWGREGTAFTDCVLMTSRDGFDFRRTNEAFLTPGPQGRNNWWYGNCFPTWGLCETPSEEEGAPNELSFYMGEGYRIKNVHFRRYTLRLDGFFSWYAPYAGGEVLTKPFVFEGGELKVNFATSALGNLVVQVCDEDGNVLPGFDSGNVFGDDVERTVTFKGDLASLAGKAVRLRFLLSDCHLYSFIFA